MVDGIGIEQWLSTHLEWSDVASLGLCLIWLIDEDEDALAEPSHHPGGGWKLHNRALAGL
ncbi:hypothetical protein [Pseudomonas yamanorum]|uniref:hypothetical protein n=1 Tax=Pseudomonas yamanorum TaxID=515393 RepID=UPI00210B901E|nr:hypothetical protein [Pseudomonas yamanorum]